MAVDVPPRRRPAQSVAVGGAPATRGLAGESADGAGRRDDRVGLGAARLPDDRGLGGAGGRSPGGFWRPPGGRGGRVAGLLGGLLPAPRARDSVPCGYWRPSPAPR